MFRLFCIITSGVVEGERRSPKYIFLGNAIPPNDIRTRGTVIQ